MADVGALTASLAMYDRWSQAEHDVTGDGMVARILDHPQFDAFDATKLMTAYRHCKARRTTLDLSDPALRRNHTKADKKYASTIR